MFGSCVLLVSLLGSLTAGETILGAYVFQRHGDRTPKALAPTNLTTLGYTEVTQAGSFFRDRYIESAAKSRIAGINSDVVKLSQLQVTAPADNVLANSAQAFTQALYPALGGQASAQTLRNGSTVQAPLNGYQLIPVGTVSAGSGSEDSGWLQDVSDCGNAETSSNNYFFSPEYQDLYAGTQDFYTSLAPVVNSTFNASSISYKNAYTIFDYINVATIHNATIPSSTLLTPPTLALLQGYAATHELALAYNATSPISAIAGMTLASQALDFLNSTVSTTAPKLRLGVQFGAYASFQSYFGPAGLLDVPGASGTNDTFRGIPDYVSAMVWELFTDADDAPSYPVPTDDLNVRFLFSNGTSRSQDAMNAYPLFGSGQPSMSWNDFVTTTQKFSVGTTRDWCVACGNATGVCAQYASAVSGGNGSGSRGGGSGMSTAVAGVIGAMVTLAVLLGVEALVLLVGGFRLVRRKRLLAARGAASGAKAG